MVARTVAGARGAKRPLPTTIARRKLLENVAAVVCKYLALFVPDLRAAEELYRQVFGMDLLFREGTLDGEWGTLPLARTWDDADAAGIELGMVALGRDGFVLALFQGEPRPGTVFEVCLGLDAEELAAVPGRLPGAVAVSEQTAGLLRFEDPFGFRWALQTPESGFRSNGELAGRWLDAG